MLKPDTQYQDLLIRILHDGEWQETRQGPRTKNVLGHTLQYDLAQSFPMITERDISGFWKGAIGELCAMINGARTLKEYAAFGCTWWGPWATAEKCAKRGLETGDIGPGSYGDVFANYPGPNGRPFNQWLALVDQIKREPSLKTHVITNWLAGNLSRAYNHQPTPTIAPCHGHVQVTILDDKLHLEMVQRSADVPVGLPSNLVQYAAITLALCKLTGYTPGSYIHHLMNAHIYEDQFESVQEMVSRPARPLPTVKYLGEPNFIIDVRPESFSAEGYTPHPVITRIPVAP